MDSQAQVGKNTLKIQQNNIPKRKSHNGEEEDRPLEEEREGETRVVK